MGEAIDKERSRTSGSVVLATKVEANSDTVLADANSDASADAESVAKVAALPCEESSETFVDDIGDLFAETHEQCNAADEKFEVSMGSSGPKEAAHKEVLRVLGSVRDALASMERIDVRWPRYGQD